MFSWRCESCQLSSNKCAIFFWVGPSSGSETRCWLTMERFTSQTLRDGYIVGYGILIGVVLPPKLRANRWTGQLPPAISQIPGMTAYRFFLYLSPNSERYFFSLPTPHCCICHSPTPVKMAVLKLLETSIIPSQAIVSNM